jgi:hypothetical protein
MNCKYYHLLLFVSILLSACFDNEVKHEPATIFSFNEYIDEWNKDRKGLLVIKKVYLNNKETKDSIIENNEMPTSERQEVRLLFNKLDISQSSKKDKYDEKTTYDSLTNTKTKTYTLKANENEAVKRVVCNYKGGKIKCLAKPDEVIIDYLQKTSILEISKTIKCDKNNLSIEWREKSELLNNDIVIKIFVIDSSKSLTNSHLMQLVDIKKRRKCNFVKPNKKNIMELVC